jgi:hypothetical protein
VTKRTKKQPETKVEHKPLPVAGYTPQQQAAIELVNFHKRMEEIVHRHLDKLRDSGETFDQRDVSIARTHIEDAFMRMNRAVFRPQRIKLPEDN